MKLYIILSNAILANLWIATFFSGYPELILMVLVLILLNLYIIVFKISKKIKSE